MDDKTVAANAKYKTDCEFAGDDDEDVETWRRETNEKEPSGDLP